VRYTLTIPVLNKLGEIITERIRREIGRKQFPYGNPTRGTSDKIATGGLYFSINYKVVVPRDAGPVLGTAPALVFDFGDTLPGKNYTLFDVVQFGVPPRRAKPPVEKILEWVKVRGLQPKTKDGRPLPPTEKNLLSLSYAIKQNIFRYGIRPAYLIEKGKRNVNDLFQNPPQYMSAQIEQLYAALEGDLTNFYENIIEE
jgi:hypothetical protein